MPPPNLTVEFLGLPGAGKSTLSHRLADLLARRGVAVAQASYDLAHGPTTGRRRMRKAMHVARELLRHPVAALGAARVIRHTEQPDLATRLKLWFNWLLVLALGRAARRDPRVHLFDQGVLQAVWSIALEDRSEAALALLDSAGARAAMPDVAVFVVAGLAAVQQRLHARGSRDSRIDRRPTDPQLLRRGEHLVERIHQAIRSDGTVRLLEARTEDHDLDAVAAYLAGALQPEVAAATAPSAAT